MEDQVLLYDNLGQVKAALAPRLRSNELHGVTAGEGGVLNEAI